MSESIPVESHVVEAQVVESQAAHPWRLRVRWATRIGSVVTTLFCFFVGQWVVRSLVGAVFGHAIGGPSAMEISTETTHITTPLDEDGLPDYIRYLDEKYGKDVTPENNAAVLAWQAVGPVRVPLERRDERFAALGMEPPPDEGDYFVALDTGETNDVCGDWLFDRWQTLADVRCADQDAIDGGRAATEENARMACYDFHAMSGQRPWCSNDNVPLADAITENRRALNLAVEASSRCRFFAPLWMHDAAESRALSFTTSDAEYHVRELADALATRAMLRLGEGRFVAAQADVMAIHRLARLVAQGPMIIGYLTAMAIDGIACDAHVALVSHPQTPDSILDVSMAELQTLERWQNADAIVDQGERLTMLDMYLQLYRGDLDAENEIEAFVLRTGMPHLLDWNLVLRRSNDALDDVVAAMRLGDRPKRAAALDLLREGQPKRSDFGHWRIARTVFGRQARSVAVSDAICALYLPVDTRFLDAEYRANMRIELVRMSMAFARYHREWGEYPDTLGELVPGFAGSVPADVFTSKPLRYERRGDGYVLYSVGRDELDDDGTNLDESIVNGDWSRLAEQHDCTGSDLVVRVPVPPLELPRCRDYAVEPDESESAVIDQPSDP